MNVPAVILSVLVMLIPSSSSVIFTQAVQITKPGCPSKCGSVKVPYPFGIGIGSGCSIHPGFDINCSTSSDPPMALLQGQGEIQIFKIYDSTIKISNQVSTMCINSSKNGARFTLQMLNLGNRNGPYTISDQNTFYVIGCGYYGLLSAKDKLVNISIGCNTVCSAPEDLTYDDCSGIGCCQTSLPEGIYHYRSRQFKQVNGSDNIEAKMYVSPCSYSFIGEKDVFKFNAASDLNDPTFDVRIKKSVPRVLEWAIGNISCAQAQTQYRTDYACQANSICVDSKRNSRGYRCRCKEGYDGNPYLPPGCQDINECEDSNKYPCYGVCNNTLGSYNCMCEHGYIGEASQKNGCVPVDRKGKFWVILFSLGVVMGIAILLVSLWLLKVLQRNNVKKRKEKCFQKNGGLLLQQQMSSGEGVVDQRTRLFTATELEKATGQFNEDRIIGRGGQGTVYKGMLEDGRIVAVKKSISVDDNNVETFINEVFVLSQVIHKNVVKLLGGCLETEVPMLVYEFVPNGTLFEFIHDNINDEFPSLWNMRLQIGTEIAAALAYLHSATSIPIYHRDIKSSNILMDDKFRAKISDFGISKLLSGDQTHVSTLIKGTMGYLDPEYFQSSHLTEKSDVYSFGVVLLELLTGKRPIISTQSGQPISLATFILSMEDKELVENVDNRVLDAPTDELIAVANLAKRCLNLNSMLRPKMKDVAMELEGIRIKC